MIRAQGDITPEICTTRSSSTPAPHPVFWVSCRFRGRIASSGNFENELTAIALAVVLSGDPSISEVEVCTADLAREVAA